MKPLRLRTSLTLIYTALVAVLLTGVGVGVHQLLVRQVDRDATTTVEEMARALHGYVHVREGMPVIAYAAHDTDAMAFVEEATRFYQIFDGTTRQLLVQSRGFEAAGLDYTPSEVAEFAEQRGAFDVMTDRGRVRIVTTVVSPEPGVTYLLQVGLSLDQTDRSIATFERRLVWGLGFGLAASALVGRWMAGRALAPLMHLARESRTIDVRTLDRRLSLRGAGDELDEVADAFNQALDRLERAVADMRQFSAALAHELRTPLAILRGEAELALSKARTQELRTPLQTQLEEFDRLQGLITQLLTLARAESGQIHISREAVDLSALTSSTVEQLEPVAEARGVALTCSAVPGAHVTGDAGWLERLVLIVLDNAIKFTEAGGSVVAEVTHELAQARLVIRDTGPGMSEEALVHAFEPFYRADPSRSRQQTGAGLGLALAKWIVDRHQGTIEIASRPGAGTTVTVRLAVRS